MSLIGARFPAAALVLAMAVAFAAGCAPPTAAAGEPSGRPAFTQAAAIDAVVASAMEEQRVPGVAVAVVREGDVLLSKGYGLADVENQVPVTPQTMFQSGSLGKMFTAAGVMALVEDGLLDLDASIRTYIPEGPAAWDAVKLRHLLSHTSGIPDYTSGEMDYTRDYAEADLVRMAGDLTLEFPPGARWNYTNTGYVLLGIVIERVAGEPYGKLLRERVWDPAGVPTMRVNFATDVVPHRASGYRRARGELHNQGWVSPTLNSTADGSLLMSLDDMIAWNEAVRSRAVLRAESWKLILTPVTLNSGHTYPYGFGWDVDEVGGHPVNRHGGSWQGFRTQFTRFVDDDVAIIVLANAAQAQPGAIAEEIAALLDPTYAAPPPPTTPIDDPDPEVTAFISAMLAKASRGELVLSDFAFVRQTSFPGIRDGLAARLAGLGAPDRLELLAVGELGDDRRMQYRAHYGERTFRVIAAVAPQGGLTELSATPERS